MPPKQGVLVLMVTFGVASGRAFGVLVRLQRAARTYLHKQLNLGLVQYPGGVRADEQDRQKTLKAKDTKIDTDEFLVWCTKNGCKPMVTANVGDGGPELVAAGQVREPDSQGPEGSTLGDWQRDLRRLTPLLREMGQAFW